MSTANPTARGCFVTGTDTGIGKTWASVALLTALNARGARAVGMKPVASGCEPDAHGRLVNDDALALQAASLPRPDYATCNPFALREAIAPHLAARRSGIAVELAPIRAAYDTLATNATHVVVEGAGGWHVPLSDTLMMSALPRALALPAPALPVVLVVGVRLGCINHASLSARAIVGDGFVLAGWIANRIDPDMPCADENIATLLAMLDAPCLGVLPYGDAGAAARAIDCGALLP
jgi:dethiobiotin synthetase